MTLVRERDYTTLASVFSFTLHRRKTIPGKNNYTEWKSVSFGYECCTIAITIGLINYTNFNIVLHHQPIIKK